MTKQAKAIMVQGTSSNVGKSILVAALCRIFKQDGYSVAPYKSQNMALNAFVTKEGGEMGRAQVVQAEAAGIDPSVHMNPILLKPEADARSQVVVLGKVQTTVKAKEYYKLTDDLLKIAMDSLVKLRNEYDVVVIEGAGSPAEINLSKHEIANMRIAREAAAPVLLVGDIDRGGVYASCYGTVQLLSKEDRKYIKGYVINKLRGDGSLLAPANKILEKKTHIPIIGVVPYFKNITIAQEDSVYLDNPQEESAKCDLDVVIVRLPHISNYDDFDPIKAFGGALRYVQKVSELGNPHIIILPGSKNTFADLKWLKDNGLFNVIQIKNSQGTVIIGICGGYQIMGKTLSDPLGIEKDPEDQTNWTQEDSGLGILDSHTIFADEKRTCQTTAQTIQNRSILDNMAGIKLSGYEIHMGRTTVEGSCAFNLCTQGGKACVVHDGALNKEGNAFGTYLHGIFDSSEFTSILLNNVRKYYGLPQRYDMTGVNKNAEYNKLADIVRQNVDMAKIYEILNKGL
ncbi:MAG: cobyric acid synthase [Chloroflexi bacterium]|nr:cobyric acid synthase [Chloroflexota bacterium]